MIKAYSLCGELGWADGEIIMKKFGWLWLSTTLVPVEAAAVSQYVNAGDTWSGMVDSYVNQYVEGTTNNALILGTQTIESGGVANGSNLYAYASQTVNGGGVSDGTNIQNRAFENVNAGGVANNTTINGGSMNVYAGGQSVGTLINSGSQIVYGEDSGATVAAGALQTVKAGGKASGTMIYGRQDVYGSAENTTLVAGTQIIQENAAFSGGTNNGGSLYIYDYATVRDLTLNGGETTIYPNVDLAGTTKINNTAVTFYDNSTIENLQMDNGRVEMFTFAEGELSIGNLSGNGVFNLESNFANGNNDTLVVNGGSGNFALVVEDYSLEGGLPEKIHLVEQNGGTENFYLQGGVMDAGAFEYELVHSGSEWVLQKTQNNTDSSVLAKNTFSALSSIFYTHLQNINTRLGESRFKKARGAWVRGIKREVDLNYNDATDSDVDIGGAQAGFDVSINQKWVKDWTVGLSAAYTSEDQTFDRDGRGDGNTNSVSIYSTMVNDKNQYLDLVGAYYYHRQKLKTYLPSQLPVLGKYDVDAWSVSAEIGQRFDVFEAWFVEPQLQVTYMWLDDISYRTNYQTKVVGEKQDSFMTRIGVRGGKDFKDTFAFPFTIYAKMGLLKEFRNKSEVSIADYTFKEDLGGTLWEIGAGMSAYIDENNNLYASVATYQGNEVKIPFDISFGFRHSF